MKSLNRGFTLAEVLTSLAIIAIIAVLTVPLLSKNSLKQQAGPIVGRVVSQAETGFQNLISTANMNLAKATGASLDRLSLIKVDDIFIDENDDSFLFAKDNSSQSTKLREFGAAFFGGKLDEDLESSVSIKNYNSSELAGVSSYIDSKTLLMTLKSNPAHLYIIPLADSTTYESGIPNQDSIMGMAVIDVNGLSKPNELGKDVFVFDFNNAGKLIPKGYSDSDHYSTNCQDNAITDGLSCTARVVKDGYRITY